MSGINFRGSALLTLLVCSLLLSACGGGSGNDALGAGSSSSGSSSGASTGSSSGGSSSGSSSGSSGSSSSGATTIGGLTPTPGTVSFTKNIAFGGQQRQVLYIHPAAATAGNAPVLLLLTYPDGTPNNMANLTRAGRIAADYGAWVVVPATASGKWADNPADPLNTTDDVGFLANVISDAGANYPVDTARVYAAGYSNSAFMVERVICDRADLLAGAAMIAATERNVEVPLCKPSRAVPAVFFNGTDDLVVPYNGLLTILLSAKQAYSNWLGYNGCNSSASATSNLTASVNDGTSVQLTENKSCSGSSAVALYTINGGGHTWPGNQMGLIDRLYLGPTTQNLDATTALWEYFTGL